MSKNYVGNKIRGSARHNFIEMAGKKFGRLTVIRIDRSYHDKVQWWCRCDCGKEGRHKGSDLRRGIVKSCGCLIGDINRANHLRKPDPLAGAVNKLLIAYKQSAKKRNIFFDLSFEKFRLLTSKNCFYCGIEPEGIILSGHNQYTYNGIDRVDGGMGYVEGNVVTCCKKCNYAKTKLSQQDFYQWTQKTYENLVKNRILGDNHEI